MNLLNRLILLLVIRIFAHSTVDAQSSPNDFLLTAFEDPTLIEYQKKFNYLQKKNYRLPLGDELEFRYGNNEQTLEEARYQIRIRPTNPWKIRRTNALYNAQKEAISLRESIEFKEALVERYSLMIQYFIAQKQTKLSKATLSLAKNKIQLFEKSIESDLFNAQNYVNAKLDMIEMLERYDNHKLIEEGFIQNITFILATDNLNWSDFNLISSIEIKNVMNEILLSSFSNSELTYLMKEFEIAKLETLVEKADFDIGFFQAEYAPFKNNGDNEFGISFGITVPIFKNNKDQIADRILNEIEWYSDLNAESYKDSLGKTMSFNVLSNYLAYHDILLTEMEKMNIKELSDKLASSEDFDPFITLKMEEGKLKLEQLVLRSTKRLLEYYLDFLYSHDVLQQMPLKNYLSNDLISIE